MSAPRRLRRALVALATFLVLMASTSLGVGCALSTARWTGAATDHFDGNQFHTPGGRAMVGRLDADGIGAFFKWQREREPGPWRAYHDEPPGPPPPHDVGKGQLRVTFINHATTLLQLDGVNVLTDPIYAERCSPVAFAGPRRVRPPGIRFEDLPRIDAVVVSHNHYDHLDVATLKRIYDTWPNVTFYVGLGNKAFLESKGLSNVVELDWWQVRELRGITVTSVPVQHFSNRGMFDVDGTLWTGYVLTGSAGRTYFAGDTGYGPHFKAAADRLGPFRLAVLPIGAYKPEWFMSPIHMSPTEAAQAALDLHAGLAIPMHYGTFPLADDGETEAVDRLKEAVAETQAPFEVLGFGQGRDVP